MEVVGPVLKLRVNLCRFPWCVFQLTLPCSSATFEALEGENQQAKERCKTTEAKVQQAGNASRRAIRGEGCEMWWYQKIYMKIIYHISYIIHHIPYIIYHISWFGWGMGFALGAVWGAKVFFCGTFVARHVPNGLWRNKPQSGAWWSSSRSSRRMWVKCRRPRKGGEVYGQGGHLNGSQGISGVTFL